MVTASQVKSSILAFISALGLSAQSNPPLDHSPKRSWAQNMMSGPPPLEATCWKRCSTLSGCDTSTGTPVSAVKR